MSNFREGAELLQRSGGGLVVKDGPELERELARLLEDRDLARRMGEAAREAFAGRQGAVNATLDLVGRHLWPRAQRTAPTPRRAECCCVDTGMIRTRRW
jgi:3-deoxy-D-manno-octulosonic-acid transferase